MLYLVAQWWGFGLLAFLIGFMMGWIVQRARYINRVENEEAAQRAANRALAERVAALQSESS